MSEAETYFDAISRGYLPTRELRYRLILHLMDCSALGGDYVASMAREFGVNKKTVESICKRFEEARLLKSYWDDITRGDGNPQKVRKYLVNSSISFQDYEDIRSFVEEELENSRGLF